MNKLYLDTCAGSLGIAIVTKDKTYKSEINAGKKTAEELFPLLQFLCSDALISLKDIEEVFVTKGPGSYTGERLGLTLAKVMATLNPSLKVYTGSTLKALAANQKENCVSLIDARNNAFFAGFYLNGQEVKEERVDISEVDQFVKENNAKIIISIEDKNAVITLKDRTYIKASILEGMLMLDSNQYTYEDEPLKAAPVYMHGKERN